MHGRHRTQRFRLGAIGLASVGALLATTSGVAVASVGTSAPAPEDCTSLVSALITAQVAEDGKSKAVVKAQREDDAAKSVRDQAVLDAGNQRKADLAAAPADDPATKDVDEHAVAVAKATDKYNLAVGAADRAYADGGSADRLAKAKAAESKTSDVLAAIKLDIGKVCTKTPAPSFKNCTDAFNAGVTDIPRSDPRYQLWLDLDRDGIACETPPAAQQSPVVAPAPETVTTHLPVTH